MNNVVDIARMYKSYPMEHGTVHALRDVSIQIAHGEAVAIMGRSGSGKSTLLHLLGCLDRPSTGTYTLNGQDVAKLNDRELSLMRAKHIGFVFQAFNLIPTLTVLENVEAPFLYHPIPPQDSTQRSLAAIEQVGLAHRIHHFPNQLSGGEMQRVTIARALAIDPWLILADEPTGNLDSANGNAILALFDQLHAKGATLIVVTHDPNVAARFPRLVNMKDGCIVV
jgi:putative ABC transport system ATP-binding protein